MVTLTKTSLENIYLSLPAEVTLYNHSSGDSAFVEDVIEIFTGKDSGTSLYELFAEDANLTTGERILMAELHERFYTPPESKNIETLSKSTDWRAGFSLTMGTKIVDEGSPVSIEESYYGWEDGSFLTTSPAYNITHILSIYEEEFTEFNGTFNDGDNFEHTVTAIVVLDGKVEKKFRYRKRLDLMIAECFKEGLR